ncbi:MAG: hypothetical protein DMF86_04225 [Acidobacteria bacterium]|nr:MAG: hypothetical protein DMF86_04225 [Acidobacteriota bacterium]
MTIAATLRVAVVAPPSLKAALMERLRQSALAEPIAETETAAANALVYMPDGPRPGRSADAFGTSLEHATELTRRGIERVIVVSSAAVYGATPYTPGFVNETWEAPPTHPNAVVEWWRAFERQATAAFAGATLTVLRPAAVLDGESYFSRLFRGAAAVTLTGYDPSIQLLAVDDLLAAIACALTKSAGGIFNVAPAGVIPLRTALRMASALRIPVPRLWQRAIRLALAPAGLAWAGDQVEFIRYSSTISGDRIDRELGFLPARTSAEALEAFLNRATEAREPRDEPAREFDRFGQDKAYIAAYGATLFTFLRKFYWRIETDGLEHVPATGRAVIAGPHRGFMPFDGVMLLHLVARGRGRYIRFLIHPSLVKFPFLFNFMTKLGGIPACRENADWTLQQDELAGVFPEGIHGAFTPYRDAYRLGKFGRDEFVRIALRNRAPIVPFAIVGSAEIFPILAKIRWAWWERWTEWPYFPITPTFPLAPIPLPSKWHVRFLEPIRVNDRYPPGAAEDPRVVREISGLVRQRIQAALDEMVARRRWIFFGSIFGHGSHG